MTDLSGWLDARRREVDAALDLYLPASPACPPRVGEAMRYSLFAGGKRLRPMLALAAAESVALANDDDVAARRADALLHVTLANGELDCRVEGTKQA